MNRTRTVTALSSAALLSLVAGCGAAGEQAGGGAGKADAGAGSVSVKDIKGEQKLDKPAKKVVALEWTYAEDLLALGVQPAGVAEKKAYGQWVTGGPKLDKSVQDVGTRQEPSLETLKALKPDLIVTSKFRSSGNYKQLKKIAPTVMFDPYGTKSEYQEMRSTLQEIGTATGKEKEADKALAEMDSKIGRAKKKIADAGKDGEKLTVARGYSTDGAATVEILGKSTIPGALTPQLGLKQGWNGKADAYGMSKVDVEALKDTEKSTFAYVAAKNDDVFKKSLSKNKLWKDLDFVKNDRVHALDPGTWFFGGPFSTAKAAEEIANALDS